MVASGTGRRLREGSDGGAKGVLERWGWNRKKWAAGYFSILVMGAGGLGAVRAWGVGGRGGCSIGSTYRRSRVAERRKVSQPGCVVQAVCGC
jgi:hypothetical protein